MQNSRQDSVAIRGDTCGPRPISSGTDPQPGVIMFSAFRHLHNNALYTRPEYYYYQYND